MDLNDYDIGAGLNKKTYEKLIEILDNFSTKEDKIRVLEFGSGMSTKFFLDYNKKKNNILDITSFDNDLKWAYKKTPQDTCLNLLIRPLVECNDNDFNNQIQNKILVRNAFNLRKTSPTWRQRNCFYDIKDNDIQGVFDIVIIDGPNGNGRNISYFHLINHIKPGTIVLIDDFNGTDNDFNYNFIKYFNYFFEAEEIYKYESSLVGNYNDGGNFIFFRIK